MVGIGVGFAGTPASHSLTGSVPVRRAGMASGTADLQRDLGGAIMQSILGALLTAGYARRSRRRSRLRRTRRRSADEVQKPAHEVVLERADTAEQYPQYAKQITQAAKTSFVDGADWAYLAGIVAILLGAPWSSSVPEAPRGAGPHRHVRAGEDAGVAAHGTVRP